MIINEKDVVSFGIQKVVLNVFDRPLDNVDLLKEVFSGYLNQRVFVNWIAVFDGYDKKPKKVPFNPFFMKNASVDKPKTWVRLDDAIDDGLINYKSINGIGIVLNDTDLTVIDVDQITDSTGNVITENITDLPIIKELVKKFNSYAEVSPSGKGIHIFIKGKIKPTEDEETTKNGVFKYDGYTAKYEFFDGVVFSKGRFVTVTGNIIGDVKTINAVDLDELKQFAINGGNIKKIEPKHKKEYQSVCVETATKEDSQVLELIQTNKRFNPEYIYFTDTAGSKLIVKLTDTGYEVLPDETNTDGFIEHPSPSEYDAALMGTIAFLTKDQAQMGRIFRSSKYYKCFRLKRNFFKCRRTQYWEGTIKKAINWANENPQFNPFRFEELKDLYSRSHDGRLTDRDFLKYLIDKGVLDRVRLLHAGRSNNDSQFINYDSDIGAWDLLHRSDTAFTDILYAETDRLIALIEEKRAKEYAELQKKIAAVEAKGEEWTGARELPNDLVYYYLIKLNNAKGITSLANLTRKVSDMQCYMDDFDNVDVNGSYLFFEDCKLDLDTGEWLDSSPEDMNTKSCAIKVKQYLNPDGSIKTDGTVQKYLHDFFTPTVGDNAGKFQEGFYNLFMEAIGSSLYSRLIEKYFYVLQGDGNTGKSVLMDSIGNALGGDTDRGYFMALDPSFFKRERGGNNDSAVNSKGKIIGVCPELGMDDIFRTETVKSGTGNETIRASAKYEKQISFKNTMTKWFETNDVGRIANGYDEAFINRLVIIKAEHVVAPEDQDKNLRRNLAKDIGGWLWFFVTAADMYRKNGVVLTPEALAIKKKYVKEMSTIANFADTCLVKTNNNDDYICTYELFPRYKNFYTDDMNGLGKQERHIENGDAFLKGLYKYLKDYPKDKWIKSLKRTKKALIGYKFKEDPCYDVDDDPEPSQFNDTDLDW